MIIPVRCFTCGKVRRGFCATRAAGAAHGQGSAATVPPSSCRALRLAAHSLSPDLLLCR